VLDHVTPVYSEFKMKDKLEVKGNSTWSIRTTCSRIEGSGDHCLIPSDAAEDMRCEARIEANEGCKVWKRCELGCVSRGGSGSLWFKRHTQAMQPSQQWCGHLGRGGFLLDVTKKLQSNRNSNSVKL
jgi:hypothetical protein